MTWKERADALLAEVQAAAYPDPDVFGPKSLALVNERLDAEGVRNKVWMVMPYRCGDCGSLTYIEAEYGVEGPPSWREDGTYIASPFGIGRCERCGGDVTHVFRDVEFDEPREPGGETFTGLSGLPTYATKAFRVTREPWAYTTEGVDDDGNVIQGLSSQPFLSTPMRAISRAMAERKPRVA